ncbi:pyruvate formate-lyase 1-activating enzyme, partial [Staphylococcus capitis]
YKWKNLGIPYQLENVEPPDDEAVKKAYRYVNFKGKISITL